MKHYQKTSIILSPIDSVFAYMDDVQNMGRHMNKNSMAMMGSKLNLQILSEQSSGPEVSYRWFGKILWMPVDFTVKVTKWIKNKEKVWGTIRKPQVIVVGHFKMHLKLSKYNKNSKVNLGIQAYKPEDKFHKLLYFLFGKWYCKWCVEKMLADTRKHFTRKKMTN